MIILITTISDMTTIMDTHINMVISISMGMNMGISMDGVDGGGTSFRSWPRWR